MTLAIYKLVHLKKRIKHLTIARGVTSDLRYHTSAILCEIEAPLCIQCVSIGYHTMKG